MGGEQYWMQRLDEYLHHREHVEGKARGTVQDDKAIVGQWIAFALEQPTDPARRAEPLLEHWVTEVKRLTSGSQDSYRAHVRPWWRWLEEGSAAADADLEPVSQDPSERLAQLVADFRADGYDLAREVGHLQARERFEEILRSLPTMPWAERQRLHEVWRPKGEGSYGGVGQIVQLGSFIDRASEPEWESFRSELSALCFGTDSLADRLQSAVDEIRGLGWASATRVVAVLDPQRVIPNYSLHNAGRWAGKLENLQMLMDERLLDAERLRRAEQMLHEHPRSKPSGRAVVESNDLLLDILRPHFSEGDSVDTWGMRSFLRWLAERAMERRAPTRDADARGHEELDLPTLVAEFRDTGYPEDRDRQHLQARVQHERTLQSLNEMAFEDRQRIKVVWAKSNQNYGWCGQQPSLDRAVNETTVESWFRLRDSLAELCFGAGELEDRIDDAVSSVSGLGYLAATKLPAVCHPEAFVPVYVLRRINKDGQALGKLDMIKLLVELGVLNTEQASEAEAIVALHEEHGDCGAVVMGSNDLLLAALGPHFTDDGVVDTWGIACFMYWLTWEYREQGSAVRWVDEGELEGLADDLLCDFETLDEIVKLLEDQGQVILYGPPGTGKTYFAQRLAWTLVGIQHDKWYEEDGPYSLVQFHPAYSYEDFFEGFRPHVDGTGNMTYALTPGPLVRLAERAAEHPDELHVMVIDEINRANLPRVLGELLYLLEYRDEWTQTQYRPEGGFELPSNLWFIGTMNTADRSIALIDAAMRRRFHFVPFFPNRPPTEGLLRRWTQRQAPEQAWVAELLNRVNGELQKDLGGDHLLIGPSHFMKPGLDEAGVRRIWTYNIEPLIEDQLFGQHEAIERFRFERVMERHGLGSSARQARASGADAPTGNDLADTDDDAIQGRSPAADGAGPSADAPADG